ncbi:MAG: hypothetical protein KC502_09555 [Myxococcales bacterium]|nr:hypothetical protein [Myxococcales bacterium]
MRLMRRSILLLVLALAACVATGCETDDAGPTKTNTLLPDGEYFVGIKLTLAGTQLRMKGKVSAEGTKEDGGKLLKFDMYALGEDWVSPTAVGSASDVEVKSDGTFTIDFGLVTVPAKASPTGSPVDANLTLAGSIDSAAGTFCGTLTGDIPAFKADLKGSTFKGVAFGKEADPYEVSCGAEVKLYKPITTCPTLKAGANEMTSAEHKRTFIVNLPAEATGTKKLPVVFVYHGNTGNAADILKALGWPTIQTDAKADPFILVAADTTADVGGSKPVLDWRFGEKVFDMDNRELVFFDDMLKCVSEQYSVDSDRIYVNGMSAGAMMTTFLTLHRGKKLAATAPFSGGYLHDWPKDAPKVPMLVTWGGDEDFAYKQNFDTLAKALMGNLDANGWFYGLCNHGTGHKAPGAVVKAAWSFLKAHKLGEKASPFAAGLPKDFPDYCKLPAKK